MHVMRVHAAMADCGNSSACELNTCDNNIYAKKLKVYKMFVFCYLEGKTISKTEPLFSSLVKEMEPYITETNF
jgi:hypothetical protein